MIRRLAMVMVLATGWAGCGGGENTEATDDSDKGKYEFMGPDGVLSDADVGSQPDVVIKPPEITDGGHGEGVEAAQPDKLPIDSQGWDETPQCDQAPYPFGCPCEANGDCAAGWCVDASDGKICTMTCYDECPTGYLCKQSPDGGPDPAFVCIPTFIDLCRPCMAHVECQQGGFMPGNFCVSYGSKGDFCGMACEDDMDCPDSYLCQLMDVEGGAPSEQCVSASGACQCTPRFVELAAATSCFIQNGFGTCDGERHCSVHGLTSCNAQVPDKEVCDGQDNDCDELFDEDVDICLEGKVCMCEGEDCSCVCQPPLLDCGDGVCVDVQSSVEHCSGCGKPCQAANVETYACQGGVCKIVKCMAGFENFNQIYGDGCECAVSPEVCDGVDNDCDGAVDEGEEACPSKGDCIGTCVDGVCQCSAGCDFCSGMCVPFLSYFEDPANCGQCGNACALPATAVHGCEGGNCFPITCDFGFADCDKIWPNGCEWTIEAETCNCVDDDCDGENDELPLADCAPPKICAGCVCQCPKDDPNIMDCGEAGCVDITSNPSHCGWCDTPCTDMQWDNVKQYGCVNKMCSIVSCQGDWVDTNGLAWDGCECLKTAATELCNFVDDNCDGQVDESPLSDCLPPLACEFGTCQCPLAQPNLQACVPGQCIDINTNPKHCGFCGNDCQKMAWDHVSKYGCADGMCNIAQCQAPWVNTNVMDFDGCECEKTSPTEVCDMIDNNCEGQVDELPNNCIPPKVCQFGECICPTDQPNLMDCGDGKCTDTYTNLSHCGFCNNKCNLPNVSVQKCEKGICYPSVCKNPYKDCNLLPDDGCEFEVKMEECNGMDDDCDGEKDEMAQGIGQACESGVPGICGPGKQVCEGGFMKCKPNIAPGQFQEVCDNKDNDCNGMEDDGNPGGGGPCSVSGLKGECKMGVLECQNGQMVCTQTTFPQPEVCDGKDNDCDGTVDQIQEDCFTMCGNGKKTCNNGAWTKCSAMEPKNCKNWDTCQMEDMCELQCPTAPKEDCNGMDDNCDNQIDEIFACSVGAFQEQSCGKCGTQNRSCTGTCSWGAWSMCMGEGACSPGQSKMEGMCGNCGQQKWVCGGNCQWQMDQCVNQGTCSPGSSKTEGSCGKCGKYQYQCTNSCTWSQQGCVGEGVCTQGTTKTEGSCGKCGQQQYSCNSSCQWQTGSCINQGTCNIGETQSQPCGKCGTQTRTCNNSCVWGNWGSCSGEGVCSPGASQSCTSACGTQSCGSNCQWNSCNFKKDSYEPNDTWASAKYWGAYNEGASIPQITNAWLHQTEYDSPGEKDRFYYDCTESGNLLDWTMELKATLSSVSGWHSLCVYYDRGCNNSTDAQKCVTGYGSLSANTGDVDANDGTNDSGCIAVEVFGDWSCSPYNLAMSCN
jgi:hypothetical protein